MSSPYWFLISLAAAWPAQPGLAEQGQGDYEVLTRGPVHEAYATPAMTGGGDVLVVPKRPPNPIEEVPPDARPEGANVVWIPGYWAWDPDRTDFLWVSGVWRSVPPGQTWVPGYWMEAEGAWRWAPGFWTTAQQQQLTYLPAPPESLERGPTSDAPSENQFWIPGCWQWRDARFAWRPGYWAPVQADWIWVPARYCWAPGGWVFLDGYWDYPLAARGLLFSPVFFNRPVYTAAAYSFTPAVVVDVGVLTSHMFAWPRYQHYCFGDWYAPLYQQRGIYPWFVFQDRHLGYDPLFVYYRWRYEHHDRDRDWERNLRKSYDYFRDHEDRRPPHTLAQQQMLRGRIHDAALLNRLTVATPLGDLQRSRNSWVRLTTVSRDARARYIRDSRDFRDLGGQRRELEQRRFAEGGRLRPAERPQTLHLPKMADVGRIFQGEAGQAPGQRLGLQPGAGPPDRTARRLDMPGERQTPNQGDLRERLRAQPEGKPQSGPQQRFGRPELERPGLNRPDLSRPGANPGGALRGPGGEIPSLRGGPNRDLPGERGPSFERRNFRGGDQPSPGPAFQRRSPPESIQRPNLPESIQRPNLPGAGGRDEFRGRSGAIDRPSPGARELPRQPSGRGGADRPTSERRGGGAQSQPGGGDNRGDKGPRTK